MPRITISVDDNIKQRISTLGGGNASVGVRLAFLLLDRAIDNGFVPGTEEDLRWLRAAAANPQLPTSIIMGTSDS